MYFKDCLLTLLTALCLFAVQSYASPIHTNQASSFIYGETDGLIPVATQLTTKDESQNGQNQIGLSYPSDTSIDTVHHRLYIADYFNNRVIVHNLAADNTQIDMLADYVIGQPNFYDNSARTTQRGLSGPNGVFIDTARNKLFVGDSGNNRVLVFDASNLSNYMMAENILGQVTFDSAAAGATMSTLTSPSKMAYDPVRYLLFVVDSALNGRVLAYNVFNINDGEVAAYKITSGWGATGVAYDSDGQRLFVSSTLYLSRVSVFDLSTISNDETIVNHLGGGFGTSLTSLNQPSDVEYDGATHYLFVADSLAHRIVKYDATSITDDEPAVAVIGQPDASTSTGLIPPTASSLYQPTGLSIDSTNHILYVSDYSNNRVVRYSTTASTYGSSAYAELGQVDKYSNPLPSFSNRSMNSGRLDVGFYLPRATAVDTVHHRLFVADGRAVLVFSLANDNTPSSLTANAIIGANAFENYNHPSFQGGPIGNIGDLAYDKNQDRLFVSDPSGNRVLVYSTANITTGMLATGVLGQPDFSTVSFATTKLKLKGPEGLAFDSTSNLLFVGDSGNARVIVFDVASVTNGEQAYLVLGQSVYTSSTAGVAADKFSASIDGLSVDESRHRLFVADSYRVVMYDLTALAIGESASLVIGKPNFTTSVGSISASNVGSATDVAIDADNNRLFVADGGYNRVEVYDLNHAANGMAASYVLGQPDFTSEAVDSVTAHCLPGVIGITYIPGSDHFLAVNDYRVSAFNLSEVVATPTPTPTPTATPTPTVTPTPTPVVPTPTPPSVTPTPDDPSNPGSDPTPTPTDYPAVVNAPFDFDGDGVSGVLGYRQSSSKVEFTLCENDSTATIKTPGRAPAVGDYNGDGITDLAGVAPKGSKLQWRLYDGFSTTLLGTRNFGAVGDTIITGCKLVSANKASLAVYHPATKQLQSSQFGEQTVHKARLRGVSIASYLGCADLDDDGIDELLFSQDSGASSAITALSAAGAVISQWSTERLRSGLVIRSPDLSQYLGAIRASRESKVLTLEVMGGTESAGTVDVSSAIAISSGLAAGDDTEPVAALFWLKSDLTIQAVNLSSFATAEICTFPSGFKLVSANQVLKVKAS